MKDKKNLIREFWLSSLALNNRTSVMVIIFLVIVIGLQSYLTMPKENFPEIKIPEIYVGTPYPGNSPLDMENLVTRPIEKEVNSITGVKEVVSSSIQDFSSIQVKFDMNVNADDALQEVKDAVDRAKSELPNDLPVDPNILKLDFGDLPVMSINLSGYSNVDVLKEYAEYLQDEIEKFPEVSRVDISGVQEKEVVINVNVYELEARQLSMRDVEGAIANENLSISGGDLLQDGIRRNIRVVGEFANVDEIESVIIKNEFQNIVYLKDVANVKFQYEDNTSYSRGNRLTVVTLNVIKRSGANLLDASDNVKQVLATADAEVFPDALNVQLINDTSKITRSMVSNLENSIISGVILVVLVLLFFLGLRNALFVGVAIPLSMLMGIMILNFMGATLNMMVLFSLILALGMLVDNAIVVVENIYRLMQEGYSPVRAAKEGTGEVALPIIASTATTLAAFFPLLFWNDITGEFMKFLPMTLIIVLSSSLFVALVINPVLTSMLMKVTGPNAKTNYIRVLLSVLFLALLAVIAHFTNYPTMRGLFIAIGIMTLLQVFIFQPLSKIFLGSVMPRLESAYEWFIRFALTGIKPYFFLLLTFGLLIGSIVLLGTSGPNILLFPEAEPNSAFIYVEYPAGTDIQKTNALTEEVEDVVLETLEPYDYMVESVLANVGKGASNPMAGIDQSTTPNKSRISIFFLEFTKRNGQSTSEIVQKVRDNLTEFPGVSIAVEKEQSGPPTGPPINIEIAGEDFGTLIALTEDVKSYLESSGVEGVEELKMDMEKVKPELLLNIDREKARRFGLSTGMIASDIRTAVFGKEVSKFKDGEDEYPINLRFNEESRYDLPTIMNQKITFRNQSNGQIVQVPISAVAKPEYRSTIGSVKRKDLERVISLQSNVLEGYNGTQIVDAYREVMEGYDLPEGYTVQFTGEQEEQEASMAFLTQALFIAIALIFLIIVTQFNSVMMPVIIVGSVIFSTIGVFLGYVFFSMDFIVIMTGIGIISLAGIVVNNAIVLIDYTNLVRQRKREELDLDDETRLNKTQVIDSIVQGGATRLRPVLLTAITTILGLIPLAVGFNIDFVGLLRDFRPDIYFGGDNTVFWGAMSWTVIFGLTFATFLTLVIVPVMYLIVDRFMSKVFGTGLNTR